MKISKPYDPQDEPLFFDDEPTDEQLASEEDAKINHREWMERVREEKRRTDNV